jgi:hypothetical protein
MYEVCMCMPALAAHVCGCRACALVVEQLCACMCLLLVAELARAGLYMLCV